ncbi:MAG: hypothetical protein NDJ89_04875 [Oligoflexia bacterium]|nr:hypothetical protein [Oligoflexia bacterium]
MLKSLFKKSMSVVCLVSLAAIAAACSSAKKEIETPAPAAPAVDAPVNLGAASGGRGI